VAQGGGTGAEAHGMALVRIHDLQGRSADQPVIHRQGDPGNRHFILYVGHHGRTETMPDRLNSSTGAPESGPYWPTPGATASRCRSGRGRALPSSGVRWLRSRRRSIKSPAP